jgi:hypothetical protein
MSELHLGDGAMLDGYVAASIRKANRTLLIANLVVLAIAAFFGYIGFSQPGRPINAGSGCSIILSLIAVTNLVRWVVRRLRPRTNPLVRKLARYGDPVQVGAEINDEVSRPRANGVRTTSKAVLTRHWLLEPGQYGLNIFRLSDIVWAYKVELKHRVYFITANVTHSVELRFASGHSHMLACDGEPAADETVMSIAQIAPWAFVGYSDKLEKLWNSDRRTFLSSVEERRRNTPASDPQNK